MKLWRRRLSALFIAAICAAVPSAGKLQTDPAPSSGSAPDATETVTLVFVPPAIGLPASRVGAGTRGSDTDTGLIALLVPTGGGLTTLEKPPLIWRVTDDFSGVMRAEVVDTSPGGRGVTRTVEGRFRRGFFALDLARSDLSMEPGRIYRWTVSIIEAGSGRVPASATGLVERVDGTSAELGHPVATARAAAERGLWFDALAPLFRVTLSGQARLAEVTPFTQLATSAGLPAAAIGPE